ncbi:hypothetical protein J6590_040461 [Homalodisca vitripennis]|nr:hypothetical protein J6590_040461 [Homalodisca vitripennis]
MNSKNKPQSIFNVDESGIQLIDKVGKVVAKKGAKHWQVGLSKRFRALKLWFVIRRYGITGLQSHIREGVRLAQNFEALVLADPRFEVPAPRHLGLVVIRLRGENLLTERLLKRLNSRGNIHCVPALLKDYFLHRFSGTLPGKNSYTSGPGKGALYTVLYPFIFRQT